MDTKHRTRTIQDLFELYRQKRLNLSPAFQRQSVWSERDRRLLVNSVLDGIPLPTVYLYEIVGKSGKQVFEVIDGKQRIESLLLFMRKGPLFGGDEDTLWVKRTFGDDELLDWWNWRELSKEQRSRFLKTEIPTIEVEGGLSEIIELFVRINATGRKLTPQERRNAHFFNSALLKAAQGAATDLESYFLKHKILSPGQIQRMKHVELVTELLISINQEMPINKKSKIDQVISGEGLDSEESARAVADLKRSVKIVDAILPKIEETRFDGIPDFYSLALLVHRLRCEGTSISAHNSMKNAIAGELLTRFGASVQLVNDQIASGTSVAHWPSDVRDYLMTVRSDTDSKLQRDRREKILRVLLKGLFDQKDPRRTFTSDQRKILWQISGDKKCSLCRKRIDKWQDLAIDHVMPHVKGGRTTISNGAITHQACNAGSGAKEKNLRSSR